MSQQKRRNGGQNRRIDDAEKRRRYNRRRAAKRRKRRRLLFGLSLFLVLLICILVHFILKGYVSKYPEDQICDNIYIGTVDVSGMTKQEAVQAMSQYLEKNEQLDMTMQVGKKSAKTSLKSLGIGYDRIEKTVDQAVQYGKKGSLWKRYRALHHLKKEKQVLKETYMLDEKQAAKTLKKQAVPLAVHAKDATISREGGSFKIEPEVKGKTIDIDASIAAITKKLNGKWKKKAFSIELVQKTEKPKVKGKDLSTIQDRLGSFSTDAGGGERRQNLMTGVEKINGTILMPGQEASVHDLTAPYDKEHGYVAAGSYENGQVVETYGGGICQVSTTLYNALLYAELEITTRYPHSMLVGYVEPSRDAAIAGDVKDLKFKNNYKTPIYIEGYISGNNAMTFNIYGKDTRKEGRTIEFESETLSTEEPGKTYKADSSAPIGSIEYSGSPHTGKTARLWKIVKQDGKEVSRDVINNSTYQKSDQIVLIGTASDNGEASGIVASAIATQDGEKISAAINRAQALE